MKKILIAGAGPVGLSAAYALSRAGLEVTVLEREATLAEDLRASTWHPPTLDLLGPLGLADEIVSKGLKARHMQHRDRKTGAIAEFDLELLRGETDHPYRVQYEQFKYTRLLLDRLKSQVRFSAGVASVSQGNDVVKVVLEDGAEYSGDCLLGADGANSAVRRAIGAAFEGMTFPERFFVLSTPFDFAEVLNRLCYVNYIADTDEFCVLLKVPGLWRCLFPTQDESDDEVLSEESVQKRLHGVFPREKPYETVHRTLYRVHQKVASTYRVGRVFLAGDAAHINNPLGGMGMNGGIHDALSLSSKIIQGENLDLYEAERRPIAIEYINANTARNRRLMAERDSEARRRAQDEMCRIAADPIAAKAFLMKSSMIETVRRST